MGREGGDQVVVVVGLVGCGELVGRWLRGHVGRGGEG